MSDQASTIMVNTLEPQSGTTLTVGRSGQNLQVNADSLKANVVKDAGGNAVFTSDGSGNISGLNAGFGSAQTLISTTTVSSAVADISFTGIDSTYKEYVFEFITIQPVTDAANFTFQAGSSYDTTLTSTYVNCYHFESGATSLAYTPSRDQGQGTAFQEIGDNVGNEADQCIVGELHLFNPASTTFVKNWYATMQEYADGSVSSQKLVAGYFNTTTALTQVQFKMSTGDINAGKIKMYGIK